ncbi:MAG TPA: hypothetical protein VI321_03320 [Burkholderiales bacterium]
MAPPGSSAKPARKTMERYGGSRSTRSPMRQARADVDRGVEDTSGAQRKPVPRSKRRA